MNVSRAVIRQFATSNIAKSGKTGEIHEVYSKLKPMQEKFQKPDGKPVFLKGGAFDVFLYRLTVAMSLVGIGGMGKLFWDLSVPKPQE